MRHLQTSLYVATALGLGVIVPAFAQDEEIIVTARRMEERLLDVPISLTVYNQQQLDNRNITQAADIAAYVPSLAVDKRFGADTSTFSIRGFTQELRTSASVGVYFADVVAPRGGGSSLSGGDGAGPGTFFDLQNVQVLKGPQGTLFGRNTTGGAVLLVPNKPTGEFGGYVEGSYGNYDMKRFQGVVNVPFSDKVKARFGIDRMVRDGYQTNTSGIGPSHFADADYVSGRASLLVDITPDIENYTVGTYINSDNNTTYTRLLGCNPAFIPGTLTAFLGPLCLQQLAAHRGEDFWNVQNNVPNPRSTIRQWQIINTTTWHATDLLTIKNIIA